MTFCTMDEDCHGLVKVEEDEFETYHLGRIASDVDTVDATLKAWIKGGM